MSKKQIVIFGIIVLVILIVIGFSLKGKKKTALEPSKTNSENATYSYDEENGEYIIYNENGEERGRVTDKVLIHKYEDNPDYDPSMAPAGADSFRVEEIEEIEE